VLESTKDPVARELFEVMARATADTFQAAITGVEPETAAQLLRTTLDIFGAEMRAWALGPRTIEETAGRIEESWRLLFTYQETTRKSAQRRVAGRSG
jgi:hypothetical protein